MPIASAIGLRGNRKQAGVVLQPVTNDRAVEKGFLSAEALGYQQRRRARRVQRGNDPLGRMSIDIRQEVQTETPTRRRGKRIHRQTRAQIRATNPHADDISDRRVFQLGDQPAHVLARRQRKCMRLLGRCGCGQVTAQRGVQSWPMFGAVDRLAVKHSAQTAGDVYIRSHRKQLGKRFAVVALTREIGIHRTHSNREIPRPRRIGSIELRDALGS